MDELRLTPAELLYLSALLGMGNMWGFADPFAALEEDELSALILQYQKSLTEKGCLTLDEENQLIPEQPLRQRLELCRDSEKVYILSSDELEKQGVQLRYFQQGNRFIRYECGSEAVLNFCDGSWLRQEICSLFGEGRGEDDPFFLKTAVARLRRMGSLSRQHFLEELQTCGCEESLAQLIVDGLQGGAEFKSLLVCSRDGEQETMDNKLVTLESAGGSLMVTAEGSDADSVYLTRLSPEKLSKALNTILGEEVVELV